MSKLYKLIIITITAIMLAAGCSETSSNNSGNSGNITDGGSSGGNGGDGSGGDGSGSSSEIINSTMRASASIDNALLYTFFTPAAATNGASLTYNWNFDDNAEETTDVNIVSHEFSKYGKSYNVTLEVNNMQTNDKENVSMIIPLPKPTVYFACSTAGLDIYCLPNISQQGINDVEYTWNIFNNSNEQIASFTTQGSHELATYTMPLSGTYTVTLSGTTPKVDGAMEYTEIVEVNQSLNRGSISHSVLSADKLQYRMRYSAGSTNGDILNYCWEIDDEINSGKCESDVNYHQGTSSTYDEITHTFPKYKKAYNIKAYVKDASEANPAVSSAIIYQDLPVVAVSATGAGLSKKFSPVFTYKPAGNLQYIWSFGDGSQSSAESPEHTYTKTGYYTVTLEIISDKFDTSIGSIKSNDVNININENINNVVIESSLKSRDKSGEKHIISSPAQSTQGALYYIWKVDGNIAAEGENIHTLEYSFPVFGRSYSVSLEVEDKTTGDKVIAEPKVIATKKPVAEIVLPPYSTPNTQVQIQAKIYFEDTGEDFILMADNPTYEWIINGQNENQNKPSIEKLFTQTQQVPVKLNIRVDNIEGSLLTAETTIYINELNLECSIADDAEDMYGAIVTCSIPTDIEGSTAYYYKFTYTEYMNGVPVAVEVPATEKTQFKIKLYEEGSIRRYLSRYFEIQWYAGTKLQYQYTGNLSLSYTAKEYLMDKVVNIYNRANISGDGRAYILTESGKVYYAGDGYNMAAPRYMYSLPEPVSNVYFHYDRPYFQTISGKIYRNYASLNEDKGMEIVKNVTGSLIQVEVINNVEYVITDDGIYMLGYFGDGQKIFNHRIKAIISDSGSSSSDKYIYTEDNRLFKWLLTNPNKIEEVMQDTKFKQVVCDKKETFVISENNEIFYNSYGKLEKMMLDAPIDGDIEIKYFKDTGQYLLNNKIYYYNSKTGKLELSSLYADLLIEDIIPYYNREYADKAIPLVDSGLFIITINKELYTYSTVVKYGLHGLGHKNTVDTPQKITQLSGVNKVSTIMGHHYKSVGNHGFSWNSINKIVVETENGTYEWGMDDGSGTGERILTPQKAESNYYVIGQLIDKSYLYTSVGAYYFNENQKEYILIDNFDTNQNSEYMVFDVRYNSSWNSRYSYIVIDGKLYTVGYNGGNILLYFVNQEYFGSIGEQ